MIPAVYPVTCHTDNVGLGSTFVVIRGFKDDGVRFIPQALAKGAKTVVLEVNVQLPDEIIQECLRYDAEIIRVENTRKALAELSASALGYPARKLKIIGVTGTKGKTTTTFLIKHLFDRAGYKTALMGTIKNMILDNELPMQLTTPQPDYLHLFFDTCVEAGVEVVVMEVAAQALSMHRIDGVLFDAAVFTNFSQEHGEFYKTMEDYFLAKKKIFNHLKPQAPCFVNADDSYTQQFSHYPTFGCSEFAHLRATSIHNSSHELAFIVQEENDHFQLRTRAFVGIHNVYNMLAATAVARYFGISSQSIQSAFAEFTGVPGRLERYNLSKRVTAFIDYAHNPSSFEAILSTLRPLTQHLLVVFGAGGERDACKRPIMGEIAQRYADIIILTTDNPRSEDPVEIISQIKAGIPHDTKAHVLIELDREQAIKRAHERAQAGAIIALLGKGVEEYQLVNGIKLPFSERAVLDQLV